MSSNTFTPDSKHVLVNLNVLIVEDSVSYSIELEQLATEVGFNVLATVDNSADALDVVFSDTPDIILMDIDIKGRLSGIDIAKRIKHLGIPILYITSFSDDETYRQAMESNIIGYIVKPVDKLTLATSLKLLVNRSLSEKPLQTKPQLITKEEEDYIFFMKNNVYQKVNIATIAYINSDDNYCNFTLTDGTSYLLRIKLTEVENLLKDLKFIRCHRQYIVNRMKIEEIDTINNTVKVLDNRIPYSRSKKSEILSIGIFIK